MIASTPKSLSQSLAAARHAKERAEFWSRVLRGRLADALVPAKDIEVQLKTWVARLQAAEKRIAKLEQRVRERGGAP